MLYREYRVHHATPDGIVVQLPGNSGFGKLTLDTLGGDALAERLLKRLASRESLHAVARHTRDAQQYRLMSIQLRELWSDIFTFPPPLAALLSHLFRQHVLLDLGATAAARVVRSTAKGALLSLPGGLSAAALEALESTSGSVRVRLLHFDAAAGVAHVTGRADVVARAPPDALAARRLLAHFRAGDRVEGVVLLSATEKGCAVLEVAPAEAEGSVLAYFAYSWPNAGGAPPIVGRRLRLTVEFAPDSAALAEVLPFLLLSDRDGFARLPPSRAVGALRRGDLGLVGHMPWRAAAAQKRGRHAESADEADGEEMCGNAPRAKLRRRRMEEELDAYERGMADAVPASAEEFQRLLLASPNNSYLWTRYMAHHVALQQYEEARLVAERALRTIGVREAQERLNVWVAYMNLENLHGTAESLASVFKRALQRALDAFVVYERLGDIFATSRKHNQLLSLCRTMVSRFRNERRAWERLGTVLVDQKKRDQMKRVLKDMNEALRRDAYCTTVVHIAIHEYRSASVEHGRALFEGLVVKFPKKSDVWSTFLDQEMAILARRASEASSAFVRSLFERTVATSFSAKVMQQFLTRFMTFEKTYGTPSDVEKVKARARAYVEAKIHSSIGAEGNAAPPRNGEKDTEES